MRSGLPIEVPPYFWTISDTGDDSEKAAILSRRTAKTSMKTVLRPQTLALIALACGVAATLFAWHLAGRQAAAEAKAEFVSQANLASSLLERRVQRYLDLLSGLQALAYHEADFPRKEFTSYVSAWMSRAVPALRAGVRAPRADSAREAFVAQVRGDRSVEPTATPISTSIPRGPRESGSRLLDDAHQRGGARARRAHPSGPLAAAERARDTGWLPTGAIAWHKKGTSHGFVIYLRLHGWPLSIDSGAGAAGFVTS